MTDNIHEEGEIFTGTNDSVKSGWKMDAQDLADLAELEKLEREEVATKDKIRSLLQTTNAKPPYSAEGHVHTTSLEDEHPMTYTASAVALSKPNMNKSDLSLPSEVTMTSIS
eukprot:UC4_evm1s411